MDTEDGIPRRQPPPTNTYLMRTQSAQQMHRLPKRSAAGGQPPSTYISSRSCDDLSANKSKVPELTVPICNSTMKIIDQMENLKFEQFDPVLTTTHKERISEQANKKLNYSNERVYTGLIDLEPNMEQIVAIAEQQELHKRKQAAKFLDEYQSLQKKRVKPDIMELFDETTMIKQTTRINLKPFKFVKMKPKQATTFTLNSLNRAQTLWKM